MIIEFIINVFCGLLSGFMSGLKVISIPMDAVTTLGTVISYGSYVVGSDFLLLFSSVIFMWMWLKFSLGIGLFLWRLLPLT